MPPQYPIGNTTIDLGNTQQVPILGAQPETYPALADTEQRNLINAITSSYSNGADVIDRLRRWKISNGSRFANKHEKTARWHHITDADLRKGYMKWDPDQSQVDAIAELHRVSQRFLTEHGIGPEIYRGVSYEQPYLLREALESDNHKDRFWPPQSVISNYTNSLRGAAYFSRLVAAKEFHPSALIVANNYLFTWNAAASPDPDIDSLNGIISPNGELHISGDWERPMTDDELLVITGDPSSGQSGAWGRQTLDTFLSYCPNFKQDEHEAMYDFVDELADRGFKITEQSARSTLDDWADEYQHMTGIDVQQTVNQIIK